MLLFASATSFVDPHESAITFVDPHDPSWANSRVYAGKSQLKRIPHSMH
jgi:hypothetical protein